MSTNQESSDECQHEGPLHTDIVTVGDSVIASTKCLVCGAILGTGSDG